MSKVTAFKKILSVFLRIVVSVILLVILFKFNKINLADLAVDIKTADKALLSVGFIILFLGYFLGFLRWQMLLKAVDIRIPVKRLVISFSGGVFFSIFLPSTIGGDVVRTTDLAQYTKKAKEVIATVFLDRLSGYIGLVIVILPALLLYRPLLQDRVVVSSVAVIVALLVFVLLVLFNKNIYSKVTRFLASPGAGTRKSPSADNFLPAGRQVSDFRSGTGKYSILSCTKIKEAIKDLHHEIHIFRRRKKTIIYNLMLSFFIQIIGPLSTYFIALSLGVKVNLIYFLIFLPIIGAITLLPIAIGGLGLRESLFVVYFAKAAVAKQLAVAMSLLSFSFIVIYGAVGGLIYVLTVHYRRLQHNPPA